MQSRSTPGAPRPLALAILGLAVAIAPGAQVAQAAAPAAPQGWFAWLGCWQLENDRTDDQEQVIEGEQLVCLSPGAGGGGILHTSLVDGEVVLEQELVADGQRRPVQEGGCDGWERGVWSADGARLYVQSEMMCEGGGQRVVSGASLLTGSDSWLDISVVNVAERRELVVRRYRATAAPDEPEGIADHLAGRGTAVRTSRMASSTTLEVEDVIEAVQVVDPAVVEAMLVETRASFPIDSRLLIALDDAQVPPGIIDLMVALSFPDYFVVNEEPAALGPAPGPVVYGYSSAWFAPFGYGYYYPWRPYPPTVIVPPGPRYGGRVVSGRGYTRVQPREDAPSGGLARLFSGGGGSGGKAQSGGSGGTVTKSGTSGGKSTGRTAKRRSGS